jgi:hypothetical protein
VVLAQILLLYDKNLSDQRQVLVPEMIEEDDFWCNYFYSIEQFKAELGLPHKLTGKLAIR